jgi:hypothetical protein
MGSKNKQVKGAWSKRYPAPKTPPRNAGRGRYLLGGCIWRLVPPKVLVILRNPKKSAVLRHSNRGGRYTLNGTSQKNKQKGETHVRTKGKNRAGINAEASKSL